MNRTERYEEQEIHEALERERHEPTYAQRVGEVAVDSEVVEEADG